MILMTYKSLIKCANVFFYYIVSCVLVTNRYVSRPHETRKRKQ